jgi:hypothetical protein
MIVALWSYILIIAGILVISFLAAFALGLPITLTKTVNGREVKETYKRFTRIK